MSDPNTKDHAAKPAVSEPSGGKIAAAAPHPPPLVQAPPVRAAAPPLNVSAPALSGSGGARTPAEPTPAAAVRPSVSRPPAPQMLSAPDEPGPVHGAHEPLRWFAADSEPGAVEVLGEEIGTDFEEGAEKRAGAIERKSAVPSRVPTTVVEEGTEFKGSFSSTCPIEVKGHVAGDVAAPSLTVAASGAVHGKVKVGELRSQGEIAGEFDADVARLSGVVKDSTVLRARSLEMRLAPIGKRMQVIFGESAPENATAGSKAPRANG